jgi:hypothetical protein
MITAAVYARKSIDQNIPDEESPSPRTVRKLIPCSGCAVVVAQQPS